MRAYLIVLTRANRAHANDRIKKKEKAGLCWVSAPMNRAGETELHFIKKLRYQMMFFWDE